MQFKFRYTSGKGLRLLLRELLDAAGVHRTPSSGPRFRTDGVDATKSGAPYYHLTTTHEEAGRLFTVLPTDLRGCSVVSLSHLLQNFKRMIHEERLRAERTLQKTATFMRAYGASDAQTRAKLMSITPPRVMMDYETIQKFDDFIGTHQRAMDQAIYDAMMAGVGTTVTGRPASNFNPITQTLPKEPTMNDQADNTTAIKPAISTLRAQVAAAESKVKMSTTLAKSYADQQELVLTQTDKRIEELETLRQQAIDKAAALKAEARAKAKAAAAAQAKKDRALGASVVLTQARDLYNATHNLMGHAETLVASGEREGQRELQRIDEKVLPFLPTLMPLVKSLGMKTLVVGDGTYLIWA